MVHDPLYCCKVVDKLVDSKGLLICNPDGGINGTGDGKCKDFSNDGKGEKQIKKTE